MKSIFEWLDSRQIPYQNKQMIMEAFTHSSYINEHKKILRDNERLEFMGDAVLQVWTSQKLFMIRPLLSEGQMTTLRAQLVCEKALANYNRQLELAQFLRLGAGEEKSGGRDRDSILADMFEAFLGALYIDQGMSAVDIILEQVVTPFIHAPKMEELIDYKTRLQEFIQADTRKNVHYELMHVEGPSNCPEFEVQVLLDQIVLGQGRGSSKKKAEQAAAKAAFDKMVK